MWYHAGSSIIDAQKSVPIYIYILENKLYYSLMRTMVDCTERHSQNELCPPAFILPVTFTRALSLQKVYPAVYSSDFTPLKA